MLAALYLSVINFIRIHSWLLFYFSVICCYLCFQRFIPFYGLSPVFMAVQDFSRCSSSVQRSVFLSFLLILGWRLWALSWNNFFILLIIIFNPFDKICSTGEKLCFPQPQISKNHLKRPIKISVNLLHPVICFLPLLRRRPMKICQSHLRKID